MLSLRWWRVALVLAALASGGVAVSARAQPAVAPPMVEPLGFDIVSGRCSETVDIFADGEPDIFIEYDYTGQPAPAEVVALRDDGADGVIDSRTRYRLDPLGRLVAVEEDGDNDGTPDALTLFEYDTEGRVRSELHDENADGRPDYSYTFEYDAVGRWVRELRRAERDGPIKEVVELEYDEQGRLAREAIDLDNDGSWDEMVSYSYSDDERQTITEDRDADGVADHRTTLVMGPDGRLVVEEWETGSGGAALSRTTHHYDADGRLARVEYDAGVNGEANVLTTYEYGCAPEGEPGGQPDGGD